MTIKIENTENYLSVQWNAASARVHVSDLKLGHMGCKARRNVPPASGAQLGAISYSFRALPSSAEEILGYPLQTGMDTAE